MTTPNETGPTESPAVRGAAQSLDEFRRALTQLTPRAWVTPTLVALNFAVFVAFCISDPKNIMEPSLLALIKWGANFGPKTTGGQPWRLFTSMFMHIGVIHIVMNMAILWDVGRIVEKMTGNVAFLVAYTLAGLGGSLASVAWNPQVTSAGASGAVFGVYGVLLGFLARSRGSVPPDVLKHLQKSAVLFIGYNVFYGLAKSGIDNAAHVGGLVTGFLCGLALAHPLTVEGARGRAKKALAVFAAGLALVGGATFALPHGVDYLAELERFDEVEAKMIPALNDVVTHEQPSDEVVASRLEREVLVPWHAERERLQGLKGLPAAQQAFIDKLIAYLKERESALTTMIDAAKKHDTAAYKAGLENQRNVHWNTDENK
jgi:rhomboid protease GluP